MAIGDPYITATELKVALEITDSSEDALVERAVNAASRAIEKRSGWPTFWKTATAETRSVPLAGMVVPTRRAGYSFDKLLLRTGIASASGFLVAGYNSPVLMPEDAIAEGEPADAIRLPFGATSSSTGFMSVTAVWGWPEVPADIIWACQMQAHRFYRRKGSPEGVAGSAEWGLTRVPALDPDVLAILKGGGYMRAGIG